MDRWQPSVLLRPVSADKTTDETGPIVWIILDETARANRTSLRCRQTVEAGMYFSAATIAELAPLARSGGYSR